MPSIKKVTMPRPKPPAGYVAPNQGRKRPNPEVYNSSRHRKGRIAYLKENPLCAECLKKGKTEEATEFDHIQPINQGGDAWDIDNKQGLCKSCHARKSAKERHQAKRA